MLSLSDRERLMVSSCINLYLGMRLSDLRVALDELGMVLPVARGVVCSYLYGLMVRGLPLGSSGGVELDAILGGVRAGDNYYVGHSGLCVGDDQIVREVEMLCIALERVLIQ